MVKLGFIGDKVAYYENNEFVRSFKSTANTMIFANEEIYISEGLIDSDISAKHFTYAEFDAYNSGITASDLEDLNNEILITYFPNSAGTGGGGITVPIPISDVTGLQTALDAIPDGILTPSQLDYNSQTVASASTITLTQGNGNVVYISGTTDVNTISVGWISGETSFIIAIPTGVFNFTNAGNIQTLAIALLTTFFTIG